MTDSRLQRLVNTAAIGSIPLITICILLPLTIYVGNYGEFASSYADLLSAVLPYVAIGAAILGLPGVFLSGTLYSRYIAILAALAVLVWLQGNILVWDYGVLDGRDIKWFAGGWRGVLDIGIWSLVIGAGVIRYERLGRVFVLAAIGTLGIQSVAAATVLVSQLESLQAPSQIERDRISGEAMPRFSRKLNVVHIVMDGFQSDIFSDITNDPTNAAITEQLQGFTFYRDNLGAYPYTQVSIPAFLSSRLYRNEIPMDDFVSNVLSGDTILSAAFDAGFEVDIAAMIPLKHVYSRGKHNHAFAITGSRSEARDYYVRNDLAKIIDLSLFRAAPHFAKNVVYRGGLWLLQPIVATKVNAAVQYFADLLFLDRLAKTMTVDRDEPVYKMFHVMLSHRPTVGNENCEFDGFRVTNRTNVTLQARCGLKWVAAVLKRMSDLGIYRDSLIVLMGDHGAWVPVEDLINERENRTGIKPLWIGMARPFLAIKPPGASGDLQVSDAPTSAIDVPVTISNLIGLEGEFGGVPVFSIPDELSRDRRHLFYPYGPNPDAEGFLYPITEYRVEGKTLDASAWHIHAQHLPAAQNGD